MKAVFKSTAGAGAPAAAAKEGVKENIVTVSPGEYIFHEGELGTEMFIIQEGEVHISKVLQGETHVLSRLEKGDFFGEMAILENVPRTADAVANTEVKLIPITGSRFDEMLRKNPEIAVRIIRKYSKRLRESNALLERLAGKTVTSEENTPPETTRANREGVDRYRVVDIATGNAFYLADGHETTIGRSDPVTGIMPDIDLTPVDTSRSVSRRHAKIVRQADGFAVLEEVGTVNGTFVNDQRIPTGVPVPIVHGDRLKIGLIQMKVVFEA